LISFFGFLFDPEDGGDISVSELRGVTTHKTALFILKCRQNNTQGIVADVSEGLSQRLTCARYAQRKGSAQR
jgi:hypothetical protein